MDPKRELRRFGERVGYTAEELAEIPENDPRVRQITRLAKAAPRYSIEAKVVKARNCNSGYRVGDRFLLDVDGNLLSQLCPKRICLYAISQVVVPVALINERLSEGLDPNQFHFMHQVRCLDVGVECAGYGEVMLEVKAVPREKLPKSDATR
ncbi:MAG: hypothetical protein A2Y80_06810 [Deltaproteobacteria bacterium RBG_13_58_19]|nr:MAG: hypothetical protein A2Y80_06810 [Deltaproteobacteria bacterium RBG_13_58_19]